MKDLMKEGLHDQAHGANMKDLMLEDRFDMIRQEDKGFIVAFTDKMSELGYGFDGKIGDGFCWGKYMVIYTKSGIRNKNVLARIYIREDGIVLRLYFNKVDAQREFIENAPSHIKDVFSGESGRCNHCRNEKDGACKFRKTYVIDGIFIEKCNGMTFEFREPDTGKLDDYMDLIRAFLVSGKKKVSGT
jgi:hypothetical protein